MWFEDYSEFSDLEDDDDIPAKSKFQLIIAQVSLHCSQFVNVLNVPRKLEYSWYGNLVLGIDDLLINYIQVYRPIILHEPFINYPPIHVYHLWLL